MNLLLPVEIQVRELESKLALAIQEAARGRTVWVGQSAILHRLLPFLQPGLYLGKDLTPPFRGPKSFWYPLAKKRGWRVIHLDEEGAVHPGPESEWRRNFDARLDPNWLAPDDWICTWGDLQREHYQAQRRESREQIVTTGHPRFDMAKIGWRGFFESRIRRIQDRFGKFILVNTNYPIPNHHQGPAKVFSEVMGYRKDRPRDRMAYVRQWGAFSRKIAHVVELIHHLTVRFPKMKIVLRPHPSEDENLYKATLGRLDSVSVIREGQVLPWVFAARALIHDGCTTALEAHLAETPVIAYEAEDHPLSAKLLPNALGWHCRDEESVFRALKAVVAGGDHPSRVAPVAGHAASDLLWNLQGRSWDKLADVIERAAWGLHRKRPPPDRDQTVRAIAQISSQRHRLLFQPRQSKGPGANYRGLKFAPLKAEFLDSLMTHLCQQLNASATWTLVGGHVVRINPQA
jgi:surface carbohydrate biosynthesis protein